MLLEDGISLPSLFLPAAKVTGCLSPSDHKSPFYPSLCLYLPLQTPANKSLGLRKVEPERWKAGRAVHGGAEQKMSSPARTSDKQTQTEVRKPCVWVQPWDLNLRNVTHTHTHMHGRTVGKASAPSALSLQCPHARNFPQRPPNLFVILSINSFKEHSVLLIYEFLQSTKLQLCQLNQHRVISRLTCLQISKIVSRSRLLMFGAGDEGLRDSNRWTENYMQLSNNISPTE